MQRSLPVPHSEEAERAVLGALLLEPGLIPGVRGRLLPEDFYFERHQVIFAALLTVTDAGGLADTLSIYAHLQQAGLADFAGGLAYLSILEDDLLAAERIGERSALVIERSCRRRLIQAAGEAIRLAAESASPLTEALARLQEEIIALDVRLATGGGGELLGDILAGDEPRADPGRVGWGWAQADRLTLGFPEQTLTVLAGQSGMGKSSAAASIIRFNAKRGRRVVLRSVEEGRQAWGRRLLAQEAGVSLYRLIGTKRRVRDVVLRPEELDRVAATEPGMAAWRVTIIDSAPDARGAAAPDDPEGITSTLLAEHAREEIDLAVIDHLQDARTEEGWEGLVRAMKAFRVGVRQGIPTLVLSQVSPRVEQRAQRYSPKSERADWLAALRPLKSDLGGASALEQIPDVIGFIFRPDYFSRDGEVLDGKAELILRKNRYGPENKIIPLRWHPESTAFEGN